MEVRVLDKAIEKMKKKFLQVNRNPFLPESLKLEKLRSIDKWIKDTESVRDSFVKTLMEKGS